MNILLRSVFIGDKADHPELAYRNFLALRDSGLVFDVAEDGAIWTYVQDFGLQHNHSPDIATLRTHFQTINELTVHDRLEQLQPHQPLYKGDFEVRLNKRAEERRTHLVQDLLRDCGTITTSGLEIKEGKKKRILHGPIDAIQHMLNMSHDIIVPVGGARLSGEVTSDTEDFLREYETRKADPLAGIGQFTGIAQLDDAMTGAKKYELWTHAAFTSHGKCVAGDTEIFSVSDDKTYTVKELFDLQFLPTVYTLDENDWCTRTASVSHVFENGVKQLYKIKTSSGREIRVTDNHPFRRATGWVECKDLRVGHDIARPSVREWLGENIPDVTGSVMWDRIESITPDGVEMTYDLTVPGTHNFVANGLFVHNSLFQFNWVYNQAIFFGHSSVIFSLEMPYHQVRRILISMHSMHERFRDVRMKLGLQKDRNVDTGLPYKKLRSAILSPEEEIFMRQYVLPDLDGKPTVPPHPADPVGGYGKIHIEVADPQKADFTLADARHRAELIYQQSPFQSIFIDHLGLMAPRQWVSSATDRMNEIFRDAKRMAMAFNRGQGMAVIALYQINREGFKAAEKAGGNYNLTHLSQASEAEKSSDVVTATWLGDEMRKENKIRFQCLKARDDGFFDPFTARIEWPYRRLMTDTGYEMVPDDQELVAQQIEAASHL